MELQFHEQSSFFDPTARFQLDGAPLVQDDIVEAEVASGVWVLARFDATGDSLTPSFVLESGVVVAYESLLAVRWPR